MTTHDEPTLADSSEDPAPAVQEPSLTSDDDTTASVAETPVEPPTRESPSDDVLFADDELADLRERWAGVQAAFVDDPKDCVHKADGLVSDLVEQLTHGFSDARSRLEEQWSRGEEASTEDLRLALMHYRAFFERLLSV
jgi:hypothetical protein